MRRTLALLFCCLLVGCGPSPSAPEVIQAPPPNFPRPPASDGNPSVIRVVISIRKGNLYLASPDQPNWHEIHVGPQEVTMDNGVEVILRAREVEWSFGQSTMTLANGTIAITENLDQAGTSAIVFAPNNGVIHVSRDGEYVKNVSSDKVDIDANSGKVIWN